MLIFTRRIGEEAIITIPPSNKEIKVTAMLIGMKGNQARIGFDAPIEVTIHRKEIQDKVDLQNDDRGNR